MAKHIYHIPLQKIQQSIKHNKDDINKLCLDKKLLEFNKLIGKSHYSIAVESFIKFFKIDKDITYALNTLEYFNSSTFIDIITNHFNFTQFTLEENKIAKKDFFYAVCNILYTDDNKLFKLFFEKTFIHYHSSYNNQSNIHIDYKDMVITLAKSKKLDIKESFGENDTGSFFKLYINDELFIDEKGKLIKSLRKKAYKNLLFYLLNSHTPEESSNIYNDLHELKMM